MTTASAAAAPEGEGGEPGLFAALLALLGPQPTAEGQAPAPTAPAETGAPAAPLTDVLAVPAAANAVQTQQGKSLLKNLGDALIAINDALAAGKPIDPALEKKLSDSLDAVAVYVGTITPPAPQIDPRITALASGDGIIPQAAPILPAAPADPAISAPTPADPAIPAPALSAPEPFAPATGLTINTAASAPSSGTSPDSSIPTIQAAVAKIIDALVAPEQAEPAPATPVASAATAPATTPVPAGTPADTSDAPAPANPQQTPPPAALVKLAQYVEAIGKTLAVDAPGLSAKLQTLAKNLASGTAPPDLIAELSGDAASADPEIARILEALAAPKPATAKAPPPQPFIAPSLVIPEAVAKSTKPASTTDTPASTPLAAFAEPSTPRDADSLRRTMVINHAAPADRPTDAELKPAATAAAPPAATAPDATPQPPPAPLLAAGAAAARSIHAAYQTPVQQVNLPQVAFEVVRQFEAGNSRFQIRLDPAELGRIDIKLDVDKSGTINARMTVERPETLDLLQRDQRSLQQALQQAGLDGSKTNLEFSLRQNPFAQQGGMGDGRGDQSGFSGRGGGFAGGDEAAAETAATTYRGTASASGVNLFV